MNDLNENDVLRVFRLVHEDHDPVTVGSQLFRISDHSNQKIAKGMYFALTREDALEYARNVRKHEYSHLLTCRVNGVTRDDLIDLISDPNQIEKLKFTAPYNGLTLRQRNAKYCEDHGKKGLLWKSSEGWREFCLLPAFVGDAVVIEVSEKL